MNRGLGRSAEETAIFVVFEHFGWVFRSEYFARCLNPQQLYPSASRKPTTQKMTFRMIFLVDLTGIEPVTSSMP